MGKDTEKKRGRGRPPITIDLEQIEEMASELISQEVIADEMDFSVSLFMTRDDVKKAWKKGNASARANLHHYQFLLAKNGNPQMLVWLGKQYLGQHDTQYNVIDTNESKWFVDDETAET